MAVETHTSIVLTDTAGDTLTVERREPDETHPETWTFGRQWATDDDLRQLAHAILELVGEQ
jgi:hypothetical protein